MCVHLSILIMKGVDTTKSIDKILPSDKKDLNSIKDKIK